MSKNVGNVGFGDILMEIVVDQHDGSGATAGKALDELDTILAVWTDWRAVMMTTCTGIDAGRLAELFADVVTPRECAGESAADPDNRFAWSFLTKPRIESDQFKNIDRLQIKSGGNPVDPAVIDEAEVILPEMEKRERSAPFGNRIVSHGLVDLGQKIGWDLVRLLGTSGSSCMRVHEVWNEIKNRCDRKEGNG